MSNFQRWVAVVRFLAAASVSVMLGASAGVPVLAQDEATDPAIAVEDCRKIGLNFKISCYSLARAAGDGAPAFTLEGIIVRSKAAVPEKDPILVLAGGPGQAATDIAPTLMNILGDAHESRDIIFFDIRGVGMSGAVDCLENYRDLPPLTYVSFAESSAEMRRCYETKGSSLRGMSTGLAAADIEAVRAALGIEQFNIWGGSYGTRLAQFYAYQYPAHVRSLVLDAVVPFALSYFELQPQHALNSLSRLTDDCVQEPACSSAYPGFDALKLLERVGTEKTISYQHPVTGRRVSTKTSRDVVAQTVFTALYSPETRVLVPFALTEAVEHDNWAPMAVIGTDTAQYLDQTTIAVATYLAISCAEEVSKFSISDFENMPLGLLHPATHAEAIKLCESWPTKPERLPVPGAGSMEMPAILISGAYDPITPPVFGEEAVKYFMNARHFVVENGGHINSGSRCMVRFLTDFIADPTDYRLKPDCVGDGFVPAFSVGAISAGEAQ